jgi:hypothetical protein
MDGLARNHGDEYIRITENTDDRSSLTITVCTPVGMIATASNHDGFLDYVREHISDKARTFTSRYIPDNMTIWSEPTCDRIQLYYGAPRLPADDSDYNPFHMVMDVDHWDHETLSYGEYDEQDTDHQLSIDANQCGGLFALFSAPFLTFAMAMLTLNPGVSTLITIGGGLMAWGVSSTIFKRMFLKMNKHKAKYAKILLEHGINEETAGPRYLMSMTIGGSMIMATRYRKDGNAPVSMDKEWFFNRFNVGQVPEDVIINPPVHTGDIISMSVNNHDVPPREHQRRSAYMNNIMKQQRFSLGDRDRNLSKRSVKARKEYSVRRMKGLLSGEIKDNTITAYPLMESVTVTHDAKLMDVITDINRVRERAASMLPESSPELTRINTVLDAMRRKYDASTLINDHDDSVTNDIERVLADLDKALTMLSRIPDGYEQEVHDLTATLSKAAAEMTETGGLA